MGSRLEGQLVGCTCSLHCLCVLLTLPDFLIVCALYPLRVSEVMVHSYDAPAAAQATKELPYEYGLLGAYSCTITR